MGMLIISIFIVVSISLLEFIDRSEWEELEEKNALRLTTNRAYGAYKLRNQQSTLVVLILGGVCLFFAIYIGAQSMTFGSESNDKIIEKASQYVDTTEFALSLDAPDESPPGSFNQKGNNGDNLPQARDGAEQVSDNPERIKDDSKPKPERPKKLTPEEEAKAFEQSLFENAPGTAARKKILEQAEKEKKEREKKAKEKAITGGDGGKSGGNIGPKGNTQVSWELGGRDAHEHDDWNVRNPGYTCGKLDAKVVVAIKVNSNGEVTSATIKSNDGGNSCCVEQAIAYAKKSRFMYSSTALQEGTITYRFKSQ